MGPPATTVRLTDGGYVDNTAAASIIHHLANNDELDDFEVISFVNTDGTIETGTLSPDTAMLFGVGTTGATAQMCLGSICVTVPSPQASALVRIDPLVLARTDPPAESSANG